MKGARRYLRGRQEIPDLELMGLVPEEHADKVAKWLTEIMEAVGDSVVNEDAPPGERIPIKADTQVCN